jgi:hypothetical protein
VFENAELIHRYTRAVAIRDGALIDVSTSAREAGFGLPLALTPAPWARCVAVPPGVACRDEAVRRRDVLTMLRFAIREGNAGAPVVRFAVHVRNGKRDRTPPLVRFKAVCGPGDQGRRGRTRSAIMAGLFSPPVCFDPKAFHHIRSALTGGCVECALQKALTAAGRRETYRLGQTGHQRGPASERFLLAIQAAVEELEGIGAALAAGDGPDPDGNGEATTS